MRKDFTRKIGGLIFQTADYHYKTILGRLKLR